ncbi:hypothetical protein [Microvirga solisilvae]|uniref:hypothetical protein n=1 Tax=Microvirga solisilvae TaxID=2919498 RepID=UPI001FB00874|nr:hypothetical protein [Microvirga solisilvae]
MSDRHLVYKLLARALLDMRVAAYQEKNKGIFDLADLFHNIPYHLDKAQTEHEFKEIVEFLEARAQQKGMAAWLNHARSEISSNEA